MDKHAEFSRVDETDATPASSPSALSLEEEVEHLSHLLHSVRSPLGSQESAALLALAQHMQSMVDPLTCTLRSMAFLHHLETEMHRVRRGRSELALICFSLHGEDAIVQQHGPDAVQLAHQALACCLKEYVLPCDCIGYIPTGHSALILPGAGSFKAQSYMEKILKECAGQGLRTSCGAFMPHFYTGIACATGPQAQAETLVEEALTALENARHSHCFCMVYRATVSDKLYQTLVHSNEKRFLFSGGQ